MGLPMDRLVIATNSNDILARFWKTGRYERVELDVETAVGRKQSVAAVRETLSPAMDILVSSNFERLLWYLAHEAGGGGSVDSACAVVNDWMRSVKSNGRVEVPQQVLELARRDFTAERVSDNQVWVSSIGPSVGIQRLTYPDPCNNTAALRVRALLRR